MNNPTRLPADLLFYLLLLVGAAFVALIAISLYRWLPSLFKIIALLLISGLVLILILDSAGKSKTIIRKRLLSLKEECRCRQDEYFSRS